jgi:D-alanyl-D-alanine carboxypeptidase (penicillin-binding protein 5/6)
MGKYLLKSFVAPFHALTAAALLSTLPQPEALAATRKKASAKPPGKPAPLASAPPTSRETPLEQPPGELSLKARGAIVVDAHSGSSLYEKNADQPQYPASTTKIMTALLVIEAGALEQEVEITLEDSRVGESSLEIKPGQHFPRRQMLYGLMLKSANDVAHALARDNAGSVEAFAEKMTRRASELGATATHFANPHGLHHSQHFTSPRDLALITRAAMSQPLFRQIVATEKHPWVSDFNSRDLFNHNRLLARFPGCTGVKTGYTIPAQQVLVSAALRDGREVISVVMHTDKPGIWDDSTALLNFGLKTPLPPSPLFEQARRTP